MAGYLNWANAILGDMTGHREAWRVRGLIEEADEWADQALRSFRRWEYLDAVTKARRAYARVATAARQIGASTPTLDAARRALPGTASQRIVCEVRHPLD